MVCNVHDLPRNFFNPDCFPNRRDSTVGGSSIRRITRFTGVLDSEDPDNFEVKLFI